MIAISCEFLLFDRKRFWPFRINLLLNSLGFVSGYGMYLLFRRKTK